MDSDVSSKNSSLDNLPTGDMNENLNRICESLVIRNNCGNFFVNRRYDEPNRKSNSNKNYLQEPVWIKR